MLPEDLIDGNYITVPIIGSLDYSEVPLTVWYSGNVLIVFSDRYAIFSTRISHLVSLYSCMRCMHHSPENLHTTTGF